MISKHYLGVVDWIVIAISLLITLVIGIVAKMTGQKGATKDYILAGKQMSMIPVLLSITVTVTSPVSFLGLPSEMYRYGFLQIIQFFSVPFGMFLASWIFIPVYFQSGVSTVNEFLEMRFGRRIKFILSVLSLVQMLLYMAASLFGAVLALSAVTNLPLEISVVSLGVICAFYCSVGGLRAVLWTDVYQALLMGLCIISLYIAGVGDAGGFSKIYERAKETKRLDIFRFELDLMERYSFWGCLLNGLLYGFSMFGTNQVEVQRILSMSTVQRGTSTLRISSFPVFITYSACAFFGLVLHSVYYLCDPILNQKQTGLTRYDQLVPSYIVNKFSSIPGMTGLCVAGIFSASLSTVSSLLNSASTVTVIDLIKPRYMKKGISDTRVVWLAKLFSLLYGGACIGICFCILEIKSVRRLFSIISSTLSGPTTAIFLVGVLTRKASDKCVSFALLVGYATIVWIASGSYYTNYVEEPLPLSISMCPSQNGTNQLLNFSTSSINYFNLSTTPSPIHDQFHIYKISFTWYSTFSCIFTLVLILLAVLVTGWKRNVIPENSECLSPVARKWILKNEHAASPVNDETAEKEELVYLGGFARIDKLGEMNIPLNKNC